MLFAGKERDGQINQVQTTKRSVNAYKLTFCIDCATGRCLQARKEMGKSIKYRQQRGRECVQTYSLQRLCHRVVFAGEERDGQINQVQTTKRSVSAYKLTFCIDCATGRCLQARKEMGKSIKFRQQSDREGVQTYSLQRLCHRVVFAGEERYGKINQVQTTKRSVSVHKLTGCKNCATGCCFHARKEMG